MHIASMPFTPLASRSGIARSCPISFCVENLTLKKNTYIYIHIYCYQSVCLVDMFFGYVYILYDKIWMNLVGFSVFEFIFYKSTKSFSWIVTVPGIGSQSGPFWTLNMRSLASNSFPGRFYDTAKGTCSDLFIPLQCKPDIAMMVTSETKRKFAAVISGKFSISTVLKIEPI